MYQVAKILILGCFLIPSIFPSVTLSQSKLVQKKQEANPKSMLKLHNGSGLVKGAFVELVSETNPRRGQVTEIDVSDGVVVSFCQDEEQVMVAPEEVRLVNVDCKNREGSFTLISADLMRGMCSSSHLLQDRREIVSKKRWQISLNGILEQVNTWMSRVPVAIQQLLVPAIL